MDLILIIGAAIIFAYEFFTDGVKTPEQIEWEHSLQEGHKNIEKMKQATKERFDKQFKR